jgi:cell division protein FtsA
VDKHTNLVVGLDIGTTKISAVVGELTPEGGLEVIGVGQRSSKGMRKGIIVDIESTAEAMALAMEDAEVMAGVRVDGVYVGLGGGQVEGLTAEGAIELATKEVTAKDVHQVLETTRSLTLPENAEILQVVPIEFRLDDEVGIANPIGMAGSKLGIVAQVITATTPALESLMKVTHAAKIDVQKIIPPQIACARAVLTEDEQQMGVAVLDIGGGTSDIVIYNGGTLRHLGSLPVGGNHITHDLAVGLRTPVADAERFKKQHGCALVALIKADDMVAVPVLGSKAMQSIPRKLIGEIIECRVEEIFSLALQRIQQSGWYEGLAAGVVLTGGASAMPGMRQAAEAIFELPVRLGSPLNIGGLADLVQNPMYTTGVGLALCGGDDALKAASTDTNSKGVSGLFQRLASWWQNFF